MTNNKFQRFNFFQQLKKYKS